jgi:hypothetical protein
MELESSNPLTFYTEWEISNLLTFHEKISVEQKNTTYSYFMKKCEKKGSSNQLLFWEKL